MIIKGRAHTPEHKRAVVEQILAVWLEHPHLRLGQLLVNAHTLNNAVDLFYLEDGKLSQMVEDFGEWAASIKDNSP